MTILSTAEREAMEQEQCSLCGQFFPKPVELHHAEGECKALRRMKEAASSAGVDWEEQDTLSEIERDLARAMWDAARDFYGPERVAELERKHEGALRGANQEIELLCERETQSEQRERVLRETLEFYANPNHWGGAAEVIWHDSGTRARSALAVSPEQEKQTARRAVEAALSACCKAEIRFGGGVGATRYYLCSACEKACGLAHTVSPEQSESPVCSICGDERILMEPDGSKAQPCYACQPAGTTLEKASRPKQSEQYGVRLRPWNTYGSAHDRPVRLFSDGWLYKLPTPALSSPEQSEAETKERTALRQSHIAALEEGAKLLEDDLRPGLATSVREVAQGVLGSSDREDPNG